MRTSPRHRDPRVRVIHPPPPEVDLDGVAGRVTYEGSPDHKDFPSFGRPRRRRHNASPCPRSIRDPEVVSGWLRDAIRRGVTGKLWEGDFPRYVWYKHEDTVFEGRLVNRGNGTYKGFPLRKSEWPKGIEDLYAED